MSKRKDKHLPLNIDIDLLLSNYDQEFDTTKYEQLKARARARAKKWATNNPEKCRENRRKWNNSPKGKEYISNYAKTHRQEINARCRDYYARNKEKIANFKKSLPKELKQRYARTTRKNMLLDSERLAHYREYQRNYKRQRRKAMTEEEREKERERRRRYYAKKKAERLQENAQDN